MALESVLLGLRPKCGRGMSCSLPGGAGQGGSGPHTADACTGPSLPNYRRPERSIHHKYPEGLCVCEVCVCVCVGWCYYRG